MNLYEQAQCYQNFLNVIRKEKGMKEGVEKLTVDFQNSDTVGRR